MNRLKSIKQRLENATPGEWKVTGDDKHYRENYAYIKIRGTQPGNRWPIADCRYLDYDGGNDYREAKENAYFIANAPKDLSDSIAAYEVLERALETITEEPWSFDKTFIISDHASDALSRANKILEGK